MACRSHTTRPRKLAGFRYSPQAHQGIVGAGYFAPDRLPDLKPAAQAVWLGIEVHCSNDIIDGALSKLFPAATPIDFAEAYREAFVYVKMETRKMKIAHAVFKAWAEIETAHGRPESSCCWGTASTRLASASSTTNGSRSVDFNNLKKVKDPELRRACIAAAWTAWEADTGPDEGLAS